MPSPLLLINWGRCRLYSYDSICKGCGRQIVYGHNGCMMSEYCFDCRPVNYVDTNPRHYMYVPINYFMDEQDYDALDYAESRCIDDGED